MDFWLLSFDLDLNIVSGDKKVSPEGIKVYIIFKTRDILRVPSSFAFVTRS